MPREAQHDQDSLWLGRTEQLEAEWEAFEGEFRSTIPDVSWLEEDEEYERDFKHP